MEAIPAQTMFFFERIRRWPKLRLQLEQTFRHLGLYKQSPYQVYHLSRTDNYYTHIEYPKCGRTWLRYMLCQAQAMHFDIPLKNSIYDVSYPEYNLPLVYYVHGFDPFKGFDEFAYRHYLNKVIRPAGVIFQVRRPERVMVSYYFQCRYRNSAKSKMAPERVDEFVRDPNFGIQKYVEYVEYYYQSIQGCNHLVVRYEDLINNTASQLGEVLNFLSIPLQESQVNDIVLNSAKEKMREIEEQQLYKVGWLSSSQKGDENRFKVRSVKKELPEDYFDDESLQYMREVYGQSQVFQKLGYA